jgi:UTP--glucose-1-phosphate uridylyltransferase
MNRKANHLPAFIEKMTAANLPQVVIDTFSYYYNELMAGATGLISDRDIQPVNEDEIADATRLDAYAEAGREALSKAVMIILNGGLGTSMGLTRAKSLITVKNRKSFLQIIVETADRLGIDLAVMNSFSTHEDTVAAVAALAPRRTPRFFLQHKFPKILRHDFSPAHWPADPEAEWNPPGHGEVYTALHTSGLLDQLLGEGREYALIANADNLGATLDNALLGYFAEQRHPIMMEVAQRTPADMKGGHLARHKSGRLVLREIAQCPEEEQCAFQDIAHYRYFNTNSLWVNLKALARLIAKNPVVHLPIILNPKTVDPRDKTSPPVYQIETAMGAAISLFEGAAAVKVPVERFSPVKKCPDLLAVRSDCFEFGSNGFLVPNPKRRLGRIHIELDNTFYGKIDAFEERFAKGAPSLIDCEALTIQGDVYFETDIIIKGRVRIHNTTDRKVVIPAGTLIESDLVI